MSTDVFSKDSQSRALSNYLAISLPLTFLVLLIWYTFQLMERRRESLRKAQLRARPDLTGVLV